MLFTINQQEEKLLSLRDWTSKELNPENSDEYNQGYAAAQTTIKYYLDNGFPKWPKKED